MCDIFQEYEEGFHQLLVKIDRIHKTQRDQQKLVCVRNSQYANKFSSIEDFSKCSVSVISDGKLTTRQPVNKITGMDMYEFMTSEVTTLPQTGCERSDFTTSLQLDRDHQGYILAPQYAKDEEVCALNVIPCTPLCTPAKYKTGESEEYVEIMVSPSRHYSCISSSAQKNLHNPEGSSAVPFRSPTPSAENETRKAVLTSSPVPSSTGDSFSEEDILHCSSPLREVVPTSPGKLRNQSECSCESHDSGYENSDVDDTSSLLSSSRQSHDLPDCTREVIPEESSSFCDQDSDLSAENSQQSLDAFTEDKSIDSPCKISDIQSTSDKYEQNGSGQSEDCVGVSILDEIRSSESQICEISSDLTTKDKVNVEDNVLDEAECTDEAVHNATLSENQKPLAKCRHKQLAEIERRRAALHEEVERWHSYLTQQVEAVYEEEERRIQREDERVYKVNGVKTPTKKMCSFVNTRSTVSFKDFGTFSSQVVVDMNSNEAVQGYQMTSAKHVRTFESRDQSTETNYMATGLSYSHVTGNFTVTDMGADTCRIFSDQGRLMCDLELEPLEEPSQAVPVADGCTVLACSSGLKYYDNKGKFSHHLAKGDIKCPQSLTVDATGCYIVSDMHDCGSMIVTLEKSSLLPLRIFSGSHYDTSPQCFTKAWYIHLRKDGSVILSDRDDHTVKAFDAHGRFLWSAGALGAGSGQFFTPAGIAEDQLGNILVADSGNDRVQILSSTGQWLGVVVTGGENEQDIKTPMDVTIDSQGHLAVLQASGTVSLYSYLHTVL